jgi:hypothetical protein
MARAEVERLSGTESSGNALRGVTKKQRQGRLRGVGVAGAFARKSGSPVALAIAASKYQTISDYAVKRLGIKQPTLSRYLTKKKSGLSVPVEVADKVFEDFGLGDDAWPRPPKR